MIVAISLTEMKINFEMILMLIIKVNQKIYQSFRYLYEIIDGAVIATKENINQK